MAIRGITFSVPMVPVLIDETKTQTRRMVKPQPELSGHGWHVGNRHGGLLNVAEEDIATELVDYLPFSVGDQLYVREPWKCSHRFDAFAPVTSKTGGPVLQPGTSIHYVADGEPRDGALFDVHTGKYRQAMHMPRWASRLWLEVIEVRAQRLHDISDEDCLAEGVAPSLTNPLVHFYVRGLGPSSGVWGKSPRETYFALLDHLHGAGFSASNPWLAAYSFTRHMGNIDRA